MTHETLPNTKKNIGKLAYLVDKKWLDFIEQCNLSRDRRTTLLGNVDNIDNSCLLEGLDTFCGFHFPVKIETEQVDNNITEEPLATFLVRIFYWNSD